MFVFGDWNCCGYHELEINPNSRQIFCEGFNNRNFNRILLMKP